MHKTKRFLAGSYSLHTRFPPAWRLLKLTLTYASPTVVRMTDSAPSDRSRFYSVAELANEFSLTSQGIRFYEESGLIAPARVGRTRVFNYQDRARLILIQRLRRLGFSIDAIREYLNLYKADATARRSTGADLSGSPNASASSRAGGAISTRRWPACGRSSARPRSVSIARSSRTARRSEAKILTASAISGHREVVTNSVAGGTHPGRQPGLLNF